MIRNTDSFEYIECPRGGTGAMERHCVQPEAEMYNANSIYAKIVLKPHSSVGLHRHDGEAESYYILTDSGYFAEDNQAPVPVKPGDICVIEAGHSHAISNPNDEEMTFMALVYPVR